MPFGPNCEYPDFQSCVRRNQDKSDPEGYCARIQRQTEEHCNEQSSATRDKQSSKPHNRLGSESPKPVRHHRVTNRPSLMPNVKGRP